MSPQSQEHLRTYLEVWMDHAQEGGAMTGEGSSVNEELHDVETCLVVLEQHWGLSCSSADLTCVASSHSAFTKSSLSTGQINSHTNHSAQPDEQQDRPLTERPSVGRFRLLRKLGQGGMGTVFLAEDTVLQRRVAVKIPIQKSEWDRSTAERFQREAQAAARLRHTNMVGLLESGSEHGIQYLVSEFIDGPDLRHWLMETNQPIAVLDASAFIEQVADGIHAAHETGILHRDLKPANILLQCRRHDQRGERLSDFVPKVTDFGLARDVASDLELTDTGDMIGTPAYCAPEQLAAIRGEVGPPSDVFSLGTVLYQLLTETSPFRRATWLGCVQAVQNHHPMPPRSLRPDIPRDLEAVCMKCLQKQPAKRYGSAAELRDDLRRFREGRATIARPLPWWEGIQRWSLAAPYRAAFVLVSVLLMLTTVVALSMRSRELQKHETQLKRTLSEVETERTRANRLLDEAVELRRIAEDRERAARQLAYDSDMRLAATYWQRQELLPAESILARHRTSETWDLSGRLLQSVIKARTDTIGRHHGPVNEVAVVPGQRQVVSVGEDGAICHWDFKSGQLISRQATIPGPKHAVAVSPDGQTLVVSEPSGFMKLSQIHFIDLATGEIQRSIAGAPSTVESLCWNKDATALAIGSRYAGVRLWDCGAEQTRLFQGDRRNHQLAFFPSSDELLIADSEALRSWKTDDPNQSTRKFANGEGQLRFATSLEHQIIAFRHSKEPIIRVRSAAAAWRETGRLEGVSGGVNSMAISPNGRFLAAGLDDGHVQCWKLELTSDYEIEPPGVSPLSTQLIHEGPCRSLKFVDDQWLVTCGEDGVVRATDPLGSPLRDLIGPNIISGPNKGLLDVVLSADGTRLHAVDSNAGVHVATLSETQPSLSSWQSIAINQLSDQNDEPAETLHQILLKRNTRDHQWISVCESGSRVAVANTANRIAVWDVATNRLLATLVADYEDLDNEWFCSIKLSPDGRTVAAACTDSRLRVWSVENARLVVEREYTNTVECVGFSPDSKRLLVGGRFEQLELLSLPSGATIWSQQAGDGTYCVQFSSNGKAFLSGHGDGTVRLWDATTLSQLVAMHGHQTPLSTLTLSDDGAVAVSIDERGDVMLWNLRLRQPIGRLFSRSETGVRFHRLFVPPHQAYAIAVISTRHGERLLKSIRLRK